MNYVRMFPPDVVYTPKDLCRLNVIYPWHNQHLSQMKAMLQESSLPAITGNLIFASMEQLCLEIGLLSGHTNNWK
jgi:hypothetical protein